MEDLWGIFYGFRKVTPYGSIRGEKNWREQFWVFLLRTVLSAGCYFSSTKGSVYINDQREIPCKFDVFHPFL